MAADARSAAELRWRISPTGDPLRLRMGLAQVGLATLAAAFVILVSAPAEWRGLALIGLLPLALFVAYRRWLKYQQSLTGDDNVWIDAAGLHWLDQNGREQSFARESAVAFRLGEEPDTLRPVPALTLYLVGGFESQPIELHPPATEAEVRRLLVEQWQLPERSTLPLPSGKGRGEGALDYDLAIDVYSECHDDFQEWHFEGTGSAIEELFDAIAEAAHLPLPPPGAKPARRILLCRRRDPTRLRLAHDQPGYMGHDTIALSRDQLVQLQSAAVTSLGEATAASAVSSDHKFDFLLGRGNVWTFHLHVRQP
jgi:hypothetical protein